jgi:integrase
MGSGTPYANGGVTLGRSSGWWVADFTHLGKRKRKRLLKLDRPESEARAALDRVADALKALAQQQARHTVGDLWKLWLAERAKDGLSNKVYDANWKALGATFENRSWDRITTDDCRDYARARFEKGIAPATVNTELSRLRSCLHWAESMNHIGRPPKIWVPSPGRPRDIVLTPEEAASLIAAARQGDFHVGVFTVLLFATGGRHSAILDLTWDRIDFDRGIINLDDDLPPDPMHKTWRKGRAEVVMSKMARAILQEAWSGRTCNHVVEHGGRRLKSAREGFAAAVRRAELSDEITPHVIRHTVASWQQGKVATSFTAQLLGHRDEGTTRKVYQHPTAELTRPAIDVIDATLAALPELPPKAGKKASRKVEKPASPSIVDRDAATDI